MAESTFNPNPHPETSSVDGWVVHNDTGGLAWATLRASAGTSAAPSVGGVLDTIIGIRCDSITNKYDRLYRSIFLFDTSSLGTSITIASATLSIYGSNTGGWPGIIPKVNIYSSNPASNTDLVAGDFNAVGSIPFCDTPISLDDWNIGAYNDFLLNADGRAAISKTGVTKFAAIDSVYDVGNTTPPWSDPGAGFIYGYYADRGTFPPKLVVFYGLAIVTTQECTDTIAEKTTGHGTLIDKGLSAVTQHGHVWGTSVDPDTGDSLTQNGAKPNLGQFQSAITGLVPNTTYFVRAYATNSEGTVYGENVTIGSSSTIGRRDWWVERDEFHFQSEWGVEQKVKGTSIANDQDILAHLGL